MRIRGSTCSVLGSIVLSILLASICLAQEETPTPSPQNQNIYFQLPLNDFRVEHFVRQGADHEISIAKLIAGDGIVIKAQKEFTKEFLDYLSKTYGITKEEQPINKQAMVYRFSVHKKDVMLGDIVALIDHLYKDTGNHDFITSCSPIFLFEDGTAYATGRIIIQWKESVQPKEAEKAMDTFGLKIVEDLDKDTHVMIVEPTDKSGYDIFYLSHLLGPFNGNAWGLLVKSVEPEYETLSAPVTVRASIQPADGKGYPGDINGSAFKYVIKIYSESTKQINLKLNDIKVASDALINWLPKNKLTDQPVSAQAFKLESSSDPVEEAIYIYKRHKKIEQKVTTIEYTFRMYQSGTFTLTPPPVSYEIFDTQKGKSVGSDRVEGGPVEFVSASLLTEDVSMVNDIAGVPDLKAPPPPSVLSKKWFAMSYLSFAVAGLTVLTLLGLAINQLRQQQWFELSTVKTVAILNSLISSVKKLALQRRVGSFSKQAELYWQAAEQSMSALLPLKPLEFWNEFAESTRETLGLYEAGDKDRFKATELSKIAESFVGILQENQRQQLAEVLRQVEIVLYNDKHACRDPQKFTKDSAEIIMKQFSHSLGFKKRSQS